MSINKSFKESGFLIKVGSETTASESKEQKDGFFGMLLDTLGASLLGNLLADKRLTATRRGREVIWDDKEFLMLFQILAKFEIQRYYKNEPKFNSVYSRSNLPKKKYEGYEINAEEYKSIGSHR